MAQGNLHFGTLQAIARAGIVCALFLLQGGPAYASAVDDASPTPEARCEALIDADFTEILDAPTQLVKTQIVLAQDRTPAYCEVRGYVSPQVGFELRLPLSQWNQKYLQLGTGGWGGVVGQNCAAYLARG